MSKLGSLVFLGSRCSSSRVTGIEVVAALGVAATSIELWLVPSRRIVQKTARVFGLLLIQVAR